MEGGLSESSKGMIPRAVEQVFQVTEVMGKKGWEYKMEGQFLEIVSLTLFFPDVTAYWDHGSITRLSTIFLEQESWTKRNTRLNMKRPRRELQMLMLSPFTRPLKYSHCFLSPNRGGQLPLRS